MDPDSEGSYEIEHLRCHACAPLDRARADVEGDNRHGLKLAARKP